MRKTKQRTERLLSRKEELRNSDKKLLLDFWEDEGFVLSDSQRRMFLDRCTPAESITRARRALKTQFPATDVVDARRYELYQQYRFNTDYENIY